MSKNVTEEKTTISIPRALCAELQSLSNKKGLTANEYIQDLLESMIDWNNKEEDDYIKKYMSRGGEGQMINLEPYSISYLRENALCIEEREFSAIGDCGVLLDDALIVSFRDKDQWDRFCENMDKHIEEYKSMRQISDLNYVSGCMECGDIDEWDCYDFAVKHKYGPYMTCVYTDLDSKDNHPYFTASWHSVFWKELSSNKYVVEVIYIKPKSDNLFQECDFYFDGSGKSSCPPFIVSTKAMFSQHVIPKVMDGQYVLTIGSFVKDAVSPINISDVDKDEWVDEAEYVAEYVPCDEYDEEVC